MSLRSDEFYDEDVYQVLAHNERRAEKERKEAYREGYLAALKEWAIWRDGVEVVGCGNYTLAQAKEMFLKENK